MTALHGDFETRGTIDLKDVGVDVYSRHPHTVPWCLGYAFGGEAPEIWMPGQPCPERVRQHIESGGVFVAHNAPFELAIWNNIMVPRHGWPRLSPKQVRCTMAMAYAMALPGSLEKAAAAVGISEQKDLAGGRLMMQMAKPRLLPKPGTTDPAGQDSWENQKPQWWDEPNKLAALYEYCKQDVRVERELEKRLLALSPSEQTVWKLDYDINQRGVYIDRAAIKAAIAVVEREADRLNGDIRSATGNFVGFTTEVARITEWLRTRGVRLDGVAKADVLDLLANAELPDDCRNVLRIRQEAGKSSTAKLKKMLSAVSADGRIRNTTQYHGAGTGRWAGRRIQPHNMPRGTISAPEVNHLLNLLPIIATAEWIRYANFFHGSALDVISSCLRGFICAAPGHDLISVDFANIEGRVLAWLAGEDWKLGAFRAQDNGTGPEIYLVAAKMIWGLDFTKDDPERQHGKVAELACGYGGGVGAFQTMAKTYLVKVSDTLADEIKTRWRKRHPATVQYWYDLEYAAKAAVLNPGEPFGAGPDKRRVAFKTKGSFLFCRLPSGRILCYPYPKIKPTETPWGEMRDQLHFMGVNEKNQWVEMHTYGGSLSENVTQAVARDLLVEAMQRLTAAGAKVVLHVHDEIVIEVPKTSPAHAQAEAQRITAVVPAWTAGLPVSTKGWRRKRYGK